MTSSRVFYIRDLSKFFWSRYLSLRRELWSGTFPLWDPYVGGGQSAGVSGDDVDSRGPPRSEGDCLRH
jgi:hypothetical protein